SVLQCLKILLSNLNTTMKAFYILLHSLKPLYLEALSGDPASRESNPCDEPTSPLVMVWYDEWLHR
ncbi:hypothetical protein Tco_0392167, partial [Tanacetum coccineum]